MDKLNKSLGLKHLSMGMSSDYLDAINYGSTFVRLDRKYLVRDLKEFLF